MNTEVTSLEPLKERIEQVVDLLNEAADDLVGTSDMDVHQLAVLDGVLNSLSADVRALRSAISYYLATGD